MPALTHGRVQNGFNLLPRNVKQVTTVTSKNCDSTGKKKTTACCISQPNQYNKMHPGKIYQRRRIPTGPTNRKFASTTVTGRSFAAKRAIARRVAKQMPKKNDKGENIYDANGNLIVTECCNIPTATISKPVQKYRIS